MSKPASARRIEARSVRYRRDDGISHCRQSLRLLRGLALAGAIASNSLAHESPLSDADARLAATMILFGAESLDADNSQRGSEVLGELRS